MANVTEEVERELARVGEEVGKSSLNLEASLTAAILLLSSDLNSTLAPLPRIESKLIRAEDSLLLLRSEVVALLASLIALVFLVSGGACVCFAFRIYLMCWEDENENKNENKKVSERQKKGWEGKRGVRPLSNI